MLKNSAGLRILSWAWIAAASLALSACGGDSNEDGLPSATSAPVTGSSSSSAGSATTNIAPVISGTPITTVTVGSGYSFTPSATDADGNALSFSISNKPDWATFNTLTGALTGTPTVAGSFSNITISVSDGIASASLAAFSITFSDANTSGSAALSWVAPTLNTDGTPLTDLSGFTIYYGTSSSSLNSTVSINSPDSGSYTITALVPGTTYYFAIASVNTAGISSDLSSVASKTI